MKTSSIALAFAAFATAGVAYASEAPTTAAIQPAAVAQIQQWSPNQINAAQKTRADVRHELVVAEHDGEIARLNKLYQGG
jgi:hypothetical protein